ncbi:MAG: hypothetical protein CM1200mP35_01900 [Chloroflexota bacterium]|nr:MAG: hypothetical protein CM1200mP35_01900 [Chloroflexota bacterium]
MVWYSSENTPQQLVADSYNLLKDSQPNLTFEGISDGAFPVSGETGVFGGFKVLDGGSTVGLEDLSRVGYVQSLNLDTLLPLQALKPR